MSLLGPVELLVLLALLVLLVAPVWAVADAATRPGTQWAAADQSKTLWVLLLVAGLFLPVVGFVLLIVYVASVRPRLRRAA